MARETEDGMSDTGRKLVVEVDEGRCIGVAYCVDCAGGMFQLNANRVAEVIDPDGADEESIMEAARSCPVDAIIVETEDGVLLWPYAWLCVTGCHACDRMLVYVHW
jgi:ferredoxin